ncbi:unnamed protein product [Hymenolepis diminuta]|uniref:Uncharacterized protein n=1 Tax=Hymenolepis diminuta TaxID=6216 RepID=A0A564Z9Z5_HYMDI|nr:unnamed protein product [Hymenolepis diminuta]
MHAPKHNLNHQWNVAIITRSHGGDIYDVKNGRGNKFRDQNHLKPGSSLTPEQPGISDAVLRRERKDRDITPIIQITSGTLP